MSRHFETDMPHMAGTCADKLEPSGEEDYRLVDVHDSVWVEVDEIAVYIRRTGDGVVVELCATGAEDSGTIDTVFGSFDAAREIRGEMTI